MNPRERILAVGFVSLLVIGGLWLIVKVGIIERWDSLNDDISRAQKSQRDLRADIKESKLAAERWGELTPIAHNPQIGTQRFRKDVLDMLEASGLADNETTLQDSTPRKDSKSEFVTVRLKVTTRGTLEDVVDFLYEFYRRQYPARIDRVTVTGEDQALNAMRARRGSRARGSAPVDKAHQVNVSFVLTALVLPIAKEGPEQDAIEDTTPPADHQLARAKDDYKAIVKNSLFWEPVRTVAQANPIPTPPNNGGGTKAPPPPPPPPPPKRTPPAKTLVATTSLHKRLLAYVRDDKAITDPLEKIEINQPIDDGTLVLVFRRGMVVQVPDDADPDGFAYYIYWLGRPFAERVPLDEDMYPDLQAELERVLVPAASASAAAES